MIALPIIWFLAVLIWDVTTDVKKWRADITLDHDKEAWIRVALLIPSTVGFSITPGTWWAVPAAIAMQFFVFWFLFDGLYNTGRKFRWFAPGTTARLDKIKGKAVIQITGSLISLTLYVCLMINK